MRRLTAVLFLLTPLWAKGPTSKIQITGGTLASPIESRGPEVRNFQVWEGPGVAINGVAQTAGFIAEWSQGSAGPPPAGRPVYEVAFFANRDGERVVYVVRYDYDEATGKGFVALPGRGETWFQLNTQSIARGLEGRRFPATAEWDRFAAALLRQAAR